MRMTARQGDLVSCLKHGIGLIGGTPRNVLVNGAEVARLGDECTCLALADPNLMAPVFDAPNKIMAGMTDILVGGKPMAGRFHNTVHDLGGPLAPDGQVVTASWSVLLGGTTTVGDAEAARLACLEAAASRGHGGPGRDKTLQSYENCGCEATRLLANGTKKKGDPGYIDEETWFYRQLEAGDAQVPLIDDELQAMTKATERERMASQEATNALDPFAPTPEQKAARDAAEKKLRDAENRYRTDMARKKAKVRQASGGTTTAERERQLAGTPAETEQLPASMETALKGVSTGKGVILPTGGMPMKNGKTTGGHIVVVTAVVIDDSGKPVSVVYNDSFNGCGVSMPASDFDAKIDKTANANVSKKPIW
jgi:hypothetical protein